MVGPASTSQLQDYGLLISSLTPIFLALIAWFQAAHNRRSERTQGEIQKTGEATHVLVNNEHGLTLRLAAEALRHVADLTHLPEDVARAVKAEANSAAHDIKQGVLNDAGYDAPKPPPTTD